MKYNLHNGKWANYIGKLSEHFVFLYLSNKGFNPIICGKDQEQDDIIFRDETNRLTSAQVKSSSLRDHSTAARSFKNGKPYRQPDFKFGLSKGSHWKKYGQSAGKATKSDSDIHFFVCNNLKTGDVNIFNSKDMGVDIQKYPKHSLCINLSELNHDNFLLNYDFTEALDNYAGNIKISKEESLLFEIPLITVKPKQIEAA